jgi:hypothetical protein
MIPEERDALIAYVSEVERFTKQCALEFEALKGLLVTKGAITADEMAQAVKTVEAGLAVAGPLYPRFEALYQLRKWIEDQK